MNIIVCAKQVLDPETPVSGFVIDEDSISLGSRLGNPPVLNGFDENAVEAALRIKDSNNAEVTVISIGNNFVMDVMKKPISMGADNLVLVQGSELENLDAYSTAHVLASAIKMHRVSIKITPRGGTFYKNSKQQKNSKYNFIFIEI